MTDRTPKQREDDNALAAEYVLGLLSASERSAFRARLADEPGLRADLRHWEEHFASLADDIAPVPAPAALQSKLEGRLFGKQQVAGRSLWNSLGLWRGLAIASLVGLVALGSWNLQQPPAPASSEALVATVAGEQNLVTLAAYYDQEKGELRLNLLEGSAPSNRSYELWLIAGQDAPVSLGVLPRENTTRLAVPENLRAKLKDGVLAISDEPLGGSTTGAPTGSVLATGKLTVI